MDNSHIFIVRLSAAREPQHDCYATVRAVDAAEATIVHTADELATSMLLALNPTLAEAPAGGVDGPTAAAIVPTLTHNPTLGRAQIGLVASALLLTPAFWLLSRVAASDSADTALAGVLFALTGLTSGFLSGLLGIGGSLVVVPALYVLLPLLGFAADRVPHVAVGSALLPMIPTALAATLAQHRRGGIDTGWLVKLAPGMFAGAALGAVLAMHLRGPALSLLFAIQSFYYGCRLMRRADGAAERGRPRLLAWCANAPSWLVGPLIATACACAGMGGGSLSVPYLLGRQVPLLRAAATSGALNLCIAVGGALGLGALLGSASAMPASVSWLAAVVVGASAVLSVRHGVALAHRLPVGLFRKMLGGVTLLGATVLTLRTLWFALA